MVAQFAENGWSHNHSIFARDENAVTMEFLSRVGNTMPPPEFADVFMSQISHGIDSHSPC